MCTRKRTAALTYSWRLIHLSPAVLLVVLAVSSHAGSNQALDDSRISVTAVAGDVDFTMAGNAVTVAPDTTVLLPARIVTGRDGNVGLTQAGTNVNVANDTDVEIPAEAVDGNLIARLVQHRGNVFYDVAPRDLGKLRVETPLLVAVIKGTQFNVAVQPESTTISLFEGRLEIRTPDGSDVVQLNAGEIAIRSLADGAIRVVGMDEERAAVPRADAAARAAPSDLGLADRVALGDGGLAARIDTRGANVVEKPTLEIVGGENSTLAAVTLGIAVDGRAGDVALGAGVGVGSASVETGLDAGVDLGGVAVEAGLDAGVDLGGSTVDLGVDATLDVGGAVVDAGVDVTLDAGALDSSLDAGVDLGGTLDVGLDVELDGGAIDLGLSGADPAPAPAPAPSAPPPGLLGGLLGLP
jgi:hypothetical protein